MKRVGRKEIKGNKERKATGLEAVGQSGWGEDGERGY